MRDFSLYKSNLGASVSLEARLQPRTSMLFPFSNTTVRMDSNLSPNLEKQEENDGKKVSKK